MNEQATRRSLRRFAGRYLARQLKQLRREMAGVRANADIEPVHQCRVATRRLRAALALFDRTFPQKRLQRWNKPVKRLTGGLGQARDLDVQIQHLRGRHDSVDDPQVAHGIDQLIDDLVEQRHAVQPQVIEQIDRFSTSKRIAGMRRYLNKLQADGKAKPPKRHRQSLRQWIQDCLRQRLEDLYGYESCLSDPADMENHHRMRVAAKKLRYTLEIGRPLLADGAEHLDAIKRLQSMLGDIHDHDVWVDRLSQRRQATPADDARTDLRAALDHLVAEHRTERGALFVELVASWSKLDHAAMCSALTGDCRPLETVGMDRQSPRVQIRTGLRLHRPPDATAQIG